MEAIRAREKVRKVTEPTKKKCRIGSDKTAEYVCEAVNKFVPKDITSNKKVRWFKNFLCHVCVSLLKNGFHFAGRPMILFICNGPLMVKLCGHPKTDILFVGRPMAVFICNGHLVMVKLCGRPYAAFKLIGRHKNVLLRLYLLYD